MEDAAKGLFNKEYLDNWYRNYQRLETYSKQTGALADEPGEELTHWADVQRSIRHMLPGELKKKLAALNFDFESKDKSWESMYSQLARFVKDNGHAWLSADHKLEALKDWLNRQILNKRLLSKSQFQRLDSLGIEWDAASNRDQKWELMLLRLEQFHRLYGHCRVPQKWAMDRQLALWVSAQRRKYSKNNLCEVRKRRLNELGFVWSIKKEYANQWETHFQELVKFQQAHGHCRVPCKYQKLVSWIERQRISNKKNLMSAERERRLDGVNFIWSCEEIKEDNWEKRYRQLCAYKQKNGHSFVPVNCRENKALGTWVATQRGLESKGRLDVVKKRKLSELGFVWSRDTKFCLNSAYDAQWEKRFKRLKAYRRAHGSCQVSLKIDPILQRWTRWQRKLFYQGKLSVERINKLNEIHFPWSIQEGYWMRMYEALEDFRNQFGCTKVPHQWAPNPQLAAWVYRVRVNKSQLTAKKVKLLDAIGFDWTLRRKTVVPWQDMYGRLVEFKREHSHTRVPVKWHKDTKLGKWASRMRHERWKLAPERVSLLQSIAFDWGCEPAAEKTADEHELC